MRDSDYEDDPEVFRLPLGDGSLVRSTHESRNFKFAVIRRGSLQEARGASPPFPLVGMRGAKITHRRLALSQCRRF